MGRSPCCEKQHTNKGAWTKEEDERLINYIKLHGDGSWRSLPMAAGLLRCGKSCRLRWINYLRPDLKRGNFTDEEDNIIINLHSLLGNKWSLIAARLPGRTDNEIKNYWNTYIKRKLYNRGINPQTHRPPNSTAKNNATTAAAAANSQMVNNMSDGVDSDNNKNTVILSCSILNNKSVIVTDSAGDSNSNSSSRITTEESFPEEILNLDLSIGLPHHVDQPQISSLNNLYGDSKRPNCQNQQLTYKLFETSKSPVVTKAVCLCWNLGFQDGQNCSCSSSNISIGTATTETADHGLCRFNWQSLGF